MPPLFTRREAGEYLRLCDRSVDRLIKSGRLTPIRIGRTIRLRRADVERLVDAPAAASR